jgi:hypothetical protein
MKRERSVLGKRWILAGLALGAVSWATGCTTPKGDTGTSTGLPYRSNASPKYQDLPSNFRTFPAAAPAKR